MNEEHTTAVVQRYLDELGGDSPAEPIVRTLLDRAFRRLHMLCAVLLHRSYPRLTQPPLNVHADELLGAIAERLLKALREARPLTATASASNRSTTSSSAARARAGSIRSRSRRARDFR
jgi:hypothetical protein